LNLVLESSNVLLRIRSHSAERKALSRTDGAHTFSVSQ